MDSKFSTIGAFVAIGLFVLAGNCQARTIAPDVPERGDYRISSFNIRYYNDSDGEYIWENRLPAIRRFFEDEAPDIVGIQEVRHPQVADIELIEGYDCFIVFRDSGETEPRSDKDEANGIMWNSSRFTLAEKGFFWLDPDPDTRPVWKGDSYSWGAKCRRIAVYVKLLDKKQNDRPVYFYASHFDNKAEEARIESAKLVLERMKSHLHAEDLGSTSNRVFLVGDLNCDDSDEAISILSQQLNNARWTSPTSCTEATFNNFGGNYKVVLDHIFYAGPGKALSFRVIKKNYGIEYLSDHFPIIFDAE